jgi:polyhydroxyalkanoate synthesis regulator phasin
MTDTLKQAVKEELPAILQALLDAAKNGDTAAANLLLTRCCPTLKPVQEPVETPITGKTLTDKAKSILDLVCAGTLSTDDAKQLLSSLADVAKIQESDELTQRIEALEQRASK